LKKILIFHHRGNIGGAGISLIHILKSINRDVFKITVVCPSNPPHLSNMIDEVNIDVVRTKNTPQIFAHYNGGIKYALSFRTIINLCNLFIDKKNVDSIIREHTPDIVIVNSMTLAWIGKVAKRYSAKTICFHRETYQKGLLGFRTKYLKYMLSKWFDKIAFISKFDCNMTGEISGVKQIIYDRVDVEKFTKTASINSKSQLGLDERNKHILYLGGFSNLKGAHIIVEAMRYMTDLNVKLIFIGNRKRKFNKNLNVLKRIFSCITKLLKIDNESKTMKLIKKYNLNNSIIFHDPIPNAELLFNASDIVVFPSTLPHQSRPIYEAGVAKIPIVITGFHETEEFAKNGETAITFQNRDAYDLYLKINGILNNEISVEKIVENNYLQALKRHRLTTLKDDIEELLEFKYSE